MSDTTYLPFSYIPPEINEAAEKIHLFFEKQGMREWQYSHVADRRLVNKLEHELNAAKVQLKEAHTDLLYIANMREYDQDDPLRLRNIALKAASKIH